MTNNISVGENTWPDMFASHVAPSYQKRRRSPARKIFRPKITILAFESFLCRWDVKTHLLQFPAWSFGLSGRVKELYDHIVEAKRWDLGVYFVSYYWRLDSLYN